MIELTLPMPPSANRLWRKSGARMHKSTQYTDWLRTAGYMAMAQHPEAITGPYRLSIQFMRPDKRKRDLDNRIKAINDLLQTIGVIEDDSDCEVVTARWVTSGEPCTVWVEKSGVA